MVRASWFYVLVVAAVLLLAACIALVVIVTRPQTKSDITSQSLALDTKGQATVSSKITMTASATLTGADQYILNVQMSQLNFEPWQLEDRVLDKAQSSVQIVTDLSKVAGLVGAPVTLTATWSVYDSPGKAFVTRTASVPLSIS